MGLIDLFPTLLDYCSLPENRELAGVSLRPLLENPEKETGRTILTTFDRGNHALSDREWRYIRYQEGEEELYHTKHDPNEWHNLAAKEETLETLNALRTLLRSKLESLGE